MSLKPEPIGPSQTEPTAYELATLAARLYTAQFQPEWKYQHLSEEAALKDALALWVSARRLLDEWRADPAKVFPPEARPPSTPEPKRYPLALDKFLLLVLPHLSGRSGERYGIFRDYLHFRLANPLPPTTIWPWEQRDYNTQLPPFDCCQPRILMAPDKGPFGYSSETADDRNEGPLTYRRAPKIPNPSKEDVDKYFAIWQSTGIPDRQSFHYHRDGLLAWYQKHHAAKVSATHRDAGAKGLASQKRKSGNRPDATAKPDKRRGARPPIERLRQAPPVEGQGA